MIYKWKKIIIKYLRHNQDKLKPKKTGGVIGQQIVRQTPQQVVFKHST